VMIRNKYKTIHPNLEAALSLEDGIQKWIRPAPASRPPM
jgi:hypothetical protein